MNVISPCLTSQQSKSNLILVTSLSTERYNEWSEYRRGVEDEVPEMGEGNKRHLMVVVGSVLFG